MIVYLIIFVVAVVVLSFPLAWIRKLLNPKAKYFDSKHVWVVGASSGIGEQMALVLGQVRNIRLSISARRVERLQELQKQISLMNPTARVVVQPLDIRQEQQIVSAHEALRQQQGELDVVVVNSGINQSGKSTQQLSLGDVRNILETNLSGALNCILTVLPVMIRRNSGHIVTVSSLASQMGLPQSGAYCASKAALSTFVESLQVDLYQSKSKVICTDIKPGFVETPILTGRDHPKPMIMDAASAAHLMLDAVAQRRNSFAFPMSLYLASLFGHLLPTEITKRTLPYEKL